MQNSKGNLILQVLECISAAVIVIDGLKRFHHSLRKAFRILDNETHFCFLDGAFYWLKAIICLTIKLTDPRRRTDL